MSISGRLCRICLSTELQGKSVLESRAQWLLYEVAGIQVVDARLSCVCYNCQHLLNKWANFKKLCLKADGLIRELLEKQHGQQHVDVDVEAAIREWKRDVHNRQYLYSISPSRTVRTSISPNTPSQGQADADEPREQAWAAEHVKLEYTSDKDCDSVHHAQDKPELHIKAEGTDNPGEEGWAQHTDDDDPFLSIVNVKDIIQATDRNELQIEYTSKKEAASARAGQDEEFMDESIEETCLRESAGIVIDEELAVESMLPFEEQQQDQLKRRLEKSYVMALHKCNRCVLTFKDGITLENHMKKHSPSRGQHLCPLCLQYFRSEGHLQQHSDLHVLRLLCLSCGARLMDRLSMQEHLAQSCLLPLQARRSSNSQRAPKHKRKYRVGPKKSSESKGKKRVKGPKPEPPVYCVECDMHFRDQYCLKGHLEHSQAHIDQVQLTFKCDKCPSKYSTEKKLLQHTNNKHLQLKRYACELCGDSYITRNGLRYHKRRLHERKPEPKRHTCTYCPKAFTTKTLLTNHIRVHTGERPFECSQCQRCFNQKASLNTHTKLVHLKIKRSSSKTSKGNTTTSSS